MFVYNGMSFKFKMYIQRIAFKIKHAERFPLKQHVYVVNNDKNIILKKTCLLNRHPHNQ